MPSSVLDLHGWKLAVPLEGEPGQPRELSGAQLAGFTSPNFELTDEGDGVRFTAPVGGFVQRGSEFARSELRELDSAGRPAAWSSHAGVHELQVDEAITDVPPVRPAIVSAQLHGTDSYVALIRLDGNRLYVKTENAGEHTLDSDYRLGERFVVRMSVRGGEALITYGGADTHSAVTVPVDCTRCYFKVGSYLQTNEGHGDRPTSTGSVVVYDVRVSHRR